MVYTRFPWVSLVPTLNVVQEHSDVDCVTGALLLRTTPSSYNSFLIWRSERGSGGGHPILDVPSVLRLSFRGDMVLQVVIVVPFPEPELH